MSRYVNKLVSLGINPSEAYRLCFDMLKEYGYKELEILISEIERNSYCVETIQS